MLNPRHFNPRKCRYLICRIDGRVGIFIGETHGGRLGSGLGTHIERVIESGSFREVSRDKLTDMRRALNYDYFGYRPDPFVWMRDNSVSERVFNQALNTHRRADV